MAKLPAPKKRGKTKRTHVPSLQKNDLIVALDKLKALPVSNAAKTQLASILRAASNPDNERIDVVVKSLPDKRKKMIGKTARQVREITREVTARGRARLESMSEEEWQRLSEDNE